LEEAQLILRLFENIYLNNITTANRLKSSIGIYIEILGGEDEF